MLVSKAMEYQETPLKIKALKKQARTTNINEMQSHRIIAHLYTRHERGILYLSLIATWTITFLLATR